MERESHTGIELWYEESTGRGRKLRHRLKDRWLLDTKEDLGALGEQHIRIGNFVDFGLGLIIGVTQLCEANDRDYTIPLVFPPFFTAYAHAHILIAGGGDGAAAREVLRFQSVEDVRLVDPSRVVVAETQRLIKSFWNGCEKDNRLSIIFEDALAYATKTHERFDVIIVDITDPPDKNTPISQSASSHLFSEDSLRSFASLLNPGGIFVMQAQELSSMYCEGHTRLRDILKKIYPSVFSYRNFVEFFGYWQSFLMASPDQFCHPFIAMSDSDAEIRDVMKQLEIDDFSAWRAYLQSLFALPPSIEALLR